MTMPNRITTIAALALAGALVLSNGPVQAERAGVAAAVNANTKGKPPGGNIRQVVLGQDVLHNEMIETDASGQAQILMLDRTALTIGPNSTLVIDKFIYDPATKDGDLTLTLRRGLLRFTGGALSKNKPVNVKTPVATVGIRGGMGLIEVSSDDRTRAGFLFGNEMTVSIDGAITQRIGRPGFGTTIEGGAASIPRQWAGSVITEMMSKLQGSAGRTGGLASQPNASQTNAALGDALPAQDAATLSQTINSIISGTEALNQIRVSDLGNTANQSRPYNDLPPPQDPQSPNPWTGKNGMGKHGQGGNHWQNKFYRYLCNCVDFTIPANLLLVEHLNATLRDQLKLAGFTENNIPIDQLTAVFKAWQIQQGRPGKRQGKGKGRNQLPAIPQLPQ